MFAEMRVQSVFGSIVSLSDTNHSLIEGCSFLHCGNNTPGDGHAGVNSPIASLATVSDSVIRENLWQVGLSGWHFDRSWHIVQESNVFTGYIDNDESRPLPNFDGSFWFSRCARSLANEVSAPAPAPAPAPVPAPAPARWAVVLTLMLSLQLWSRSIPRRGPLLLRKHDAERAASHEAASRRRRELYSRWR